MYSFNNIPIQKSVIFVLQRVSLKIKDSITTPNHFVTRTIRTVQLSAVQLCLETKENKKGNTIISVGNNLNYCTMHKHNKAMFFMSPREVSYTHIFKSA